MRLESILFPGKHPEQFERMAAALERSAENTPHPLTIHRITDPDEDVLSAARSECTPAWINNARKAKHHARIIDAAADGELLGMIDADAMILGDLSEVESMNFDIAYTARPPQSKWRINTGVYFVRVSWRMRWFCNLWRIKAIEMLGNAAFHLKWKNEHRYGGIHQAAFGWMLENAGIDFSAVALPCEVWNCVNGCYATAENPKIVHLMAGSMRRWCMDGLCAENDNAQRFADKWREYDRMEAA